VPQLHRVCRRTWRGQSSCASCRDAEQLH
jgi:hypothetical protein